MKLVPWKVPLAPMASGEKSSKISALVPILRSDSPSRTSVLRQKLQTAVDDDAERKSTGAPQLGHAARQARCGAVAISQPPARGPALSRATPAGSAESDVRRHHSFFSSSVFLAANSSSVRMPLALRSPS